MKLFKPYLVRPCSQRQMRMRSHLNRLSKTFDGCISSWMEYLLGCVGEVFPWKSRNSNEQVISTERLKSERHFWQNVVGNGLSWEKGSTSIPRKKAACAMWLDGRPGAALAPFSMPSRKPQDSVVHNKWSC